MHECVYAALCMKECIVSSVVCFITGVCVCSRVWLIVNVVYMCPLLQLRLEVRDVVTFDEFRPFYGGAEEGDEEEVEESDIQAAFAQYGELQSFACMRAM